jgi:DNA-binding NtrC family response regulator
MSSIPVRVISQEESAPAQSLFLLIVDGDRWVRDLSREVAGSLGFKVHIADNIHLALRHMEAQPVDVILLDARQAPEGLEFVSKLKELHPRSEVIVSSGHASAESVVSALKNGACDFLRKPFKGEELKVLLTQAAGRLRNSMEDRMAREHLRTNPEFNGVLGTSAEMQKLYRIIAKVATSKHPVLVQGESGAGKETIARAIHAEGPFRERAFRLVDCASPAQGALESELFGSGNSISGTTRPRDGLYALACGGTVFFDEIGEMPLEIQSRLLRALQEREFHPQGSSRSVPVDARIIASSTRDLEMAVQQGTFRRDLFFRLNVVALRLPPLRERKEDIRPLAEHFLLRKSEALKTRYSLSHEAIKSLQAYDWPGNVRELENCLERAIAMSSGPQLQPSDFPPHIRTASLRAVVPGKQARILPLAELEKQAILEALQQLNGDKLMTARALGIGKTTLYRKLKEYGITHWASRVPIPGTPMAK